MDRSSVAVVLGETASASCEPWSNGPRLVWKTDLASPARG